jgi:hypothetical protein
MKLNPSRIEWLLKTVGWGLLAVLALLYPDQALAQLLQGTIDGNVTDSSQAVVAGASVVAVNQQTNFTRQTQTNVAGGYLLPTLTPGTYTITVKSSGFQSYSRTGVAVTANNVTRVDVMLTVGPVNESVTVSAQAGTLQTDRSDVRTDLGSQPLNNLPVPLGRNYAMLLPVVVPGVSTPSSGNSFGANPSRAVGFSVNGGSTITNNTRIDGTNSSNYNATDKPLYTPALEAIETVNVVTNSFDAEQGMAGGAAINLQMKSGSNRIHGSLFEDHSDQHLKAYAWVADRTQPKPKYVNNQYGGTIGGPIKKDKLFYFVSLEGTALRQENSVYSQVPTAAMKTGNLSAAPNPIYDPLTGNADGSGRTAFPGGVIPAPRIDPAVQAVIATGQWPNPDVPGTGSWGLARNYLSAGNSGQLRNQWDSKLNWNPSQKLSMFARFGFNDNWWDNPQQYGQLGGPSTSPNNTAVGNGWGHVFSGTVSGTYIVTRNLIVDAYYGYSRNDMSTRQQRLNENLGWTLLQIPGLQSSQWREGGWPALSIDNFGIAGSNLPWADIGPFNNFQPQDYRNVEKEWVANVSWIKGAHNIRAGVDFDQQQDNEDSEQASFCGYCAGSGGFEFSQGTTQLKGGAAGTDFNTFAAFLLGLPANAGKVTLFPDEYHAYTSPTGTYIQDRWQVTPKLTLTYGFRFEYWPFPTRVGRGMERFDTQTGQMIICGVGGNPANCGITKDTRHIAPRAGLAFRLTDSTVIRAGYGMTTDPTALVGSGYRQNFPDIVATAITAPNSFSYATTLRQGLPVVVAPNYGSGRVAVPNNIGVFTADNDNFVRGYIQSWNFTIEQRIKSWTTSAGYVATRSVDPISFLDQNWSPIGTGTAGQVLNVRLGRTAVTPMIGTMGTNKYDALQARAEHRFARGFQAGVSYAFAHALAYATNTTGTGSVQAGIPYYYHLDYGNQAGIAKHTLGLSLVAETPFGKGKKFVSSGPGARILGGWQVNALTIVRSGTPFTVTASNTTLNAVGSNQFGDCLSTPQMLGSIYQWYDKSAFAAPSAGRFGTCGTNSLWGPWLVNTDMGLDRSFVVRERFQLKFRAEVFNLANTPHHANPTGSVSSGTFMQALSIANTGREGLDERTFRFNLRLVW